jgi:drug/metabolite transporter (DMT)-like permease
MTLSSRDPHLGQRIVFVANYHTISCGVNASLTQAASFRFGGGGWQISRALTAQRSNATPDAMQNRATRTARYGPWLVGLGAALWGTESAWRIPLNELFDAKVIVFWEHVFILIMLLPILIPRLREIATVSTRTWFFLIFSGFAGSAVGTVFFTLALKHGNPTVVNVILNIQPVISTIGAFLLFGDRLARRFYLYAAIAIIAGIFVSVAYPMQLGISFQRAGLNIGTGYALICALFWGLSTVAGRGVMVAMPLQLASSMRIVVGLVCMTLILLVYGELNGAALWPAAAQTHTSKAIVLLFFLASISGGIPLLIYFQGLHLTQASTAGYFEMMQTLAAVCITWGFFHASLHRHQIIAAIILVVAVAMVHHVQQQVESVEQSSRQ